MYFILITILIRCFISSLLRKETQRNEICSDLSVLNTLDSSIQIYSFDEDILISLNKLKEIYRPEIFGFSDDLYIKIDFCRKYSNFTFNNEEIKKLLYFGIPSLEPNKNMYESIFKSFIKGSYQQIITDFLIEIRKSLMRITLQNILKEIDILFMEECYEKKSYYNSIFYEYNNLILQKYNNLLYENNFENIKDFIIVAYFYVHGNRIATNFRQYFKQEDMYAIQKFFFNKIYKKLNSFDESNYREHLVILKKYDDLIYRKDMRIIKNEHIFEIISFLHEKIPKQSDFRNFWHENSKIFFAIDFLFFDFFPFCLKKMRIYIFNGKDDFITFESSSKEYYKSYCFDFKEICPSGIFYSADWKSFSFIKNFNSTKNSFLNFMILLNIPQIAMNNFLLEKSSKNYSIHFECVESFIIFHNKFFDRESSILFCYLDKIYYFIEEVISKKFDFFSTVIQFQMRYLFREWFKIKKNINRLNNRKKQMYLTIYNMLKIIDNQDFIDYFPLFKEQNNFEILKIETKIEEMMQKTQIKSHIECLYIESHDNQVSFESPILKKSLKKVLISGKISYLNIQTDVNIYGLIFGDFYHIVLVNPNFNYDFNSCIHLRTVITPKFPTGNILISTNSQIEVYIFKFFKFKNLFSNNPRKRSNIRFDYRDGFLFGENLFVQIYSPMSVDFKKIMFQNSSISNIYSSESFICFEKNLKKRMNLAFINCNFREYLRINIESAEIKLQNCYIENDISVVNLHQIKFLKIENCKGEIFLDDLNFQEIYFNHNIQRMIHYIQNENFLIQYYKILGSLKDNCNVKCFDIVHCSINADIFLQFPKLSIIKSVGSFRIYMNNLHQKIGRVFLNKKSIIEMDLSDTKRKIYFQNLIFHEDVNSFVDKNPDIELKFKNVQIIQNSFNND